MQWYLGVAWASLKQAPVERNQALLRLWLRRIFTLGLWRNYNYAATIPVRVAMSMVFCESKRSDLPMRRAPLQSAYLSQPKGE